MRRLFHPRLVGRGKGRHVRDGKDETRKCDRTVEHTKRVMRLWLLNFNDW